MAPGRGDFSGIRQMRTVLSSIMPRPASRSRPFSALCFAGLAGVAALTAGCPRETESHFYGGQQVRQPFEQRGQTPATEPTPAPEDRGGTPAGVMEGATQPERDDKRDP